jgi:hypothetical protein
VITADHLNGERLLEAAGIETNTVKRTGVMRMTARTISMRLMQSESEQPTGFRIGPDGEVEVLTRAETAATELDELTERERVMARLAKNIGRGRDVIYHGTRALPEVMRAGKLIPPDLAERAVFFTRSPEVAAYFACLRGEKKERRSPGVLILDRSSLRQCYRLEPNRYDHFHGRNEREEAVWGRIVSFRRHLVRVVSEANVSELLGPPKRRYLLEGSQAGRQQGVASSMNANWHPGASWSLRAARPSAT